ncbi:Rieske (2Fe-2S) protein [Polymorphobacter sp.]|uniref:Rieske (2Fe-2S) protein n=1 Tax=Polymorphobacter sp. TaxID=1909290 RepID=UPI003F71728B
MPRTAIAPLDEIPENGNRAFPIGTRSVLICRSSAGVFAVENMCSHQQATLEGGKVKGPHLFCPLHGLRFDLRTGAPNGTLTKKPITLYKADVVDGIVHADLPE